MLHYIIQTIVFQLFFLIIYDVFLKKETFFNWNRIYLLITPILALIIPFIKVAMLRNILPKNYTITLPEVFVGNAQIALAYDNEITPIALEQHNFWSWELLFFSGMTVVTLIFVFKVFRLIKLILKNPQLKKEKYTVVHLLNSSSAFSFFNFIFLGEQINIKDKKAILKHEMVHVTQKHSIDLLFFEGLKIVFWFNPLIYIYHRKIQALHEFIADAEALKNQDKTQYYQNLLSQVFGTKNISFINPFFKQSLIKKRIIMLQKSKSKRINLLKYGLLLPLILGMLVLTSCLQTGNAQEKTSISKKESFNDSPLIIKINAVRHQIQRQGNVSNDEEKGLALLFKIINGEELDKAFIDDVQMFISSSNKTDLEKKIAKVFEQIQSQGNLSKEEEIALKSLLILTSEDGFNDPFFSDVLEFVEIPFKVVDQVPLYPGCDSLATKNERTRCLSHNVAVHVNRNFNTKLADSLGLKGRQRINVMFKISNTGEIVDVRSKSDSPALEKEAERVIKTLPKMIPGKHKGKTVNVPYSLPIIFQIADKND